MHRTNEIHNFGAFINQSEYECSFIVENQDSKKFVLKDGLNFESVLCIYDTETHQIEWRSMKTIASDNLNMALSLLT